MIKRHNNTNL